jgi:hypothetical protein
MPSVSSLSKLSPRDLDAPSGAGASADGKADEFASLAKRQPEVKQPPRFGPYGSLSEDIHFKLLEHIPPEDRKNYMWTNKACFEVAKKTHDIEVVQKPIRDAREVKKKMDEAKLRGWLEPGHSQFAIAFSKYPTVNILNTKPMDDLIKKIPLAEKSVQGTALVCAAQKWSAYTEPQQGILLGYAEKHRDSMVYHWIGTHVPSLNPTQQKAWARGFLKLDESGREHMLTRADVSAMTDDVHASLRKAAMAMNDSKYKKDILELLGPDRHAPPKSMMKKIQTKLHIG